MAGQTQKTALTNVRVFNGSSLSELTTITISGDEIVADASNATEIDGQGGILLPGLIDAHVHIDNPEQLHQLATYGVTTALDMACWPPSFVKSLRNQKAVADFKSAGIPLTATGSIHSKMMSLPDDAMVEKAEDAVHFVKARISEGSDYIKLIADVPGPDQETLNVAAAEARKQGMMSIAHAARLTPIRMAQEAKVDVLTHTPLDAAVTAEDVQKMVAEKRICVPTLTMMEKTASLRKASGADYSHAENSVRLMHEAGVPVLAGTDANAVPGSPAQVQHGESLHHELELMVRAGMSKVEVLRAATSEIARYFGLHDRGVIAAGKRADLVLLDGDPTEDITATRRIRKVWCAGVEVR